MKSYKIGALIILVGLFCAGFWFIQNMCLVDCELSPDTEFFSDENQNSSNNSQISQQEKDLLRQGANDPFVRHLRTVLDNYNNGVMSGYSNVDFEPYKEYINSRYVLMAINHNALGGGKDMHVVFTDKPDKLFYVWIYDESDGSLDLRAFQPDEKFTSEEVKASYESSKGLIEELSLAI